MIIVRELAELDPEPELLKIRQTRTTCLIQGQNQIKKEKWEKKNSFDLNETKVEQNQS